MSSASGTARKAIHAGAGVAGWVALVALWVWQLHGHIPVQWAFGPEALVAGLALYALVTPVWVVWNRNVYARRHTRRTPRVCDVQLSQDALGRRIVAGAGVRAGAQAIVVTLDSTKSIKTYTTRAVLASGPPPGEASTRVPRVA